MRIDWRVHHQISAAPNILPHGADSGTGPEHLLKFLHAEGRSPAMGNCVTIGAKRDEIACWIHHHTSFEG